MWKLIDAQRDADRRARKHVAQEMHSEDDARHRDQKRHRQQAVSRYGIEEAQRNRDGERRDRMARGERIFVRRQNRGPAVRLNFAGPFAAAGALERAEQKDPRHGGRNRPPRWRRSDALHRRAPVSGRARTRAIRRLPVWPQSSKCGTTAGRASGARGASGGDRSIESGSRLLWRRSYPFLHRALRQGDPARTLARFEAAAKLSPAQRRLKARSSR